MENCLSLSKRLTDSDVTPVAIATLALTRISADYFYRLTLDTNGEENTLFFSVISTACTGVRVARKVVS